MSRRLTFRIALLVTLAACSDCYGRQGGENFGRTGQAREKTALGTYLVELQSVPAPIAVGRQFALEVRVTPAAEHDDVTIAVDAGMPEHGHGMNLIPQTRRTGAGAFVVDGMLFHMPGDWEIYVDVTRAGETERARFAVAVEG